MATEVDYLIVGSGLTGGTIARCLADAGKDVLILERREHVGGNVHDVKHESGAPVHVYGPHYFRCSSDRIWDFVNRFATFRAFRPELKIMVDGEYEKWPICERLMEGWSPKEGLPEPTNFEEACLQRFPERVYESMIKGYTRKQWGVDPRTLEAGLAKRIRINPRDEHSLMPHHKHQALPVEGYTAMMENLIKGIPCLRGVDYLKQKDEFRAKKLLVSTGSIDEFYGFDEGRLTYRGQRRTVEHFPDRDSVHPHLQVNFPNGGADHPIRTLEWKYLLPPEERAKVNGTVVTHECPFSPTDPDAFEYPFPDAANQALFRKYEARAAADPKLLICGRLGSYRYYDMDQAIGRALMLADRILNPQ